MNHLEEVFEDILSKLENVKRNGKSSTARCPGHDDEHNSLSIKLTPERILLHCHTGCQFDRIAETLRRPPSDFFPERDNKPQNPTSKKFIEQYLYKDEMGKIVYSKDRYELFCNGNRIGKEFFFKHPSGNEWKPGLNGQKRVLFNLENRKRLVHDLLRATILCEGEKAAIRLQKLLGDSAWVTAIGSATGWLPEFAELLKEDSIVVFLPDCDEPGKVLDTRAAQDLAVKGRTKPTKILDLPNLGPSEDPFDWIERGGTAKDFLKLVEAAPTYNPSVEPAQVKKNTESVSALMLAEEAFYGIAGQFVKIIEPHSEADPTGLLLSFLVKFGNIIDRQPHCLVEDDYHALNLYVIEVGQTSKGRKGTGEGRSRRLFMDLDSVWSKNCVKSGLSSGEGVIFHVRDPIEKFTKDGKKFVDEGIVDKRLLIYEPEFASILRILPREGSKISSVIREAWDSGNLSNLNKNSSIKATGAHVSIIGHITEEELRRYLDRTELANGFANRFLFAHVKRSKVLPEGGKLPPGSLDPVLKGLKDAIVFAKAVEEIHRDEEAREIWREIYPSLSEGKPGLFGSVVSRAEAQVLRLSAVYAVLDSSPLVKKEHLLAAVAVWDYCENSAKLIFKDLLGDPLADEILRALRNSPSGLTRTDISGLFSRHASSSQIGLALATLLQKGLARSQSGGEKGRPAEVWFAI